MSFDSIVKSVCINIATIACRSIFEDARPRVIMPPYIPYIYSRQAKMFIATTVWPIQYFTEGLHIFLSIKNITPNKDASKRN